jgi:hypothetical protein
MASYKVDDNSAYFARSHCFDTERVKMLSHKGWVGDLRIKKEQESIVGDAGALEAEVSRSFIGKSLILSTICCFIA